MTKLSKRIVPRAQWHPKYLIHKIFRFLSCDSVWWHDFFILLASTDILVKFSRRLCASVPVGQISIWRLARTDSWAATAELVPVDAIFINEPHSQVLSADVNIDETIVEAEILDAQPATVHVGNLCWVDIAESTTAASGNDVINFGRVRSVTEVLIVVIVSAKPQLDVVPFHYRQDLQIIGSRCYELRASTKQHSIDTL